MVTALHPARTGARARSGQVPARAPRTLATDLARVRGAFYDSRAPFWRAVRVLVIGGSGVGCALMLAAWFGGAR